MTNETFKKKCYELYQLQWMMAHGHSLTDLFNVFTGLAVEEIEEEPEHAPTDETSVRNHAELLKERFLYETGFGSGSIYACYEEFLDHEFQDEGYMGNLLRNAPGHEENMARWRQVTGIYSATVTVPAEKAAFIRKAMSGTPRPESECLKGGETITATAVFQNGYAAILKCCGAKYEEGASNAVWSEAVLYDVAHNEVLVCGPGENFFGTWEFTDGSNEYTAKVEAQPLEEGYKEKLEVMTTAGTLKAYKNPDPGRPGICVMLQPKGSTEEIDVSFVHVCEDAGYQSKDEEQPEDVVVMTYADPYDEDYSSKDILHREDIVNALSIDCG